MTDWWRGAVIYQIYPRSFQDGNGDGIGDLRGILSRLEYIASLGVDAVWISPFFKSPMKDFGYDVEDYRAVDPIFGNIDDFDELLERAHGLGLKVIIDMVLSHTADTHSWFLESRASRANPKADWYVWADGKPDGTAPNNWLSIFGGPAWTWDTRRQQYYLHNFLTSQPDLNLHNEEVQEMLLAECEFWLQRGVDGFRLDACNFYMHDRDLRDNPPRALGEGVLELVAESNPYSRQWHRHDKSRPENLAFLRRLRALMERYPGSMTVAEVADDDSVMRGAEYVSGPDLLHTSYGFSLLGTEFSAALVRRALERFEEQPGDGWPAWAFSNHDAKRAPSRWGGESFVAAWPKQLLALLLSLRGTAFLYQGEELGLPEADVPFESLRDPYGITFWPDFKGRDGCRTPMPWDSNAPHAGFSRAEPWLPVDIAHLSLAVSEQEQDGGSTLAFTRALLAWRKTQPALVSGRIEFFDAPEPVLAFARRSDQQKLICVFNLGREATQWRAPKRLAAGSFFHAESAELAGRLSDDRMTVELPPNGVFYAVAADE